MLGRSPVPPNPLLDEANELEKPVSESDTKGLALKTFPDIWKVFMSKTEGYSLYMYKKGLGLFPQVINPTQGVLINLWCQARWRLWKDVAEFCFPWRFH